MRLSNMKKIFKNDSGQMLLFVLVVVLLLMMVLFAIVANVRVDIKEVQVEREYESGYSVAEEELLKISSDGFDTWENNISPGDIVSNTSWPSNLNSFCDTLNGYTCTLIKNRGAEGNSYIMVKRKTRNDIIGMTIEKDDVLEVNVNGATGILTVGWDVPPTGTSTALSLMLVCRDTATGNYQSVRAVVCHSAGGCGSSSFWTVDDAKDRSVSKPEAPLNLNTTDGGCSQLKTGLVNTWYPVVLRIRAIYAAATNVSVTGGTNMPIQMEEVRVQTFPAGVGGEIEEGLPAPEVYTLSMVEKRLPALFDYVLFVANGSADKTAP